MSSKNLAKPTQHGFLDSMYDLNTSWVYLIFPFLIGVGYVLVVWLHLPWAIVFIIYGLVPKLDQVVKLDWKNPTLAQMQALQKNQKFRLMLYITLAIDWIVFFKVINVVYHQQLSIMQLIPVTFMMMNLSSTGFLVAHQLFHKLNLCDRIIGTIHQIKNLYMHFTVQHLYGHHKRVSTPEDPATSQKGMTLYEFVPRSVIGGYVSAFKISPGLVALMTLGSTLLTAGIYKYYGVWVTLYFLCLAAGGIFILELINYIEHYGLNRKMLPDGTYEKVTIRHSWNAPHRISNYLFFKLQRHSDHHENSYKPYQTLCSYEDSPQLPHGYLVCLMIAAFPSKWFEMMDPLVDQYARAEKGTNLKTLAIAQHKAEEVTDYFYLVTAGAMLLEIFIKYGL